MTLKNIGDLDFEVASISHVNDPEYPDLTWKPEDGDGIKRQLVMSFFPFENAVSVRANKAFGDW